VAIAGCGECDSCVLCGVRGGYTTNVGVGSLFFYCFFVLALIGLSRTNDLQHREYLFLKTFYEIIPVC
jgi:hypothetical protein